MSPALTHSQKAPWQMRRMALLERALADVKRESDDGKRELVATIRKVAARYTGRRLGDGRFLKLSAKSLERYWYTSVKSGNLEPLRLRFGHSAAPSRIPAYARFLCRYLAASEGLNVPELYTRLKALDAKLPFSKDTLRRAMPALELAAGKRARLAAVAAIRRMIKAEATTLAFGLKHPRHQDGRTGSQQVILNRRARPAQVGRNRGKQGPVGQSGKGKT